MKKIKISLDFYTHLKYNLTIDKKIKIGGLSMGKKMGRPKLKEEDKAKYEAAAFFSKEDYDLLQEIATQEKTKPGMLVKKVVKEWLETKRKMKKE
ncbi:hypothetical protein [Fusobacterium necrophorum]|nr:hypothetical protein [Fusobacterium necrophorum]